MTAGGIERVWWHKCADDPPPREGLYLVWCASADEAAPFRHIAWWNPDTRAFELIVRYWGAAVERDGWWAEFPAGPTP